MSTLIRARMAALRNRLLSVYGAAADDPGLAAAITVCAERLQAHLDSWDDEERSALDISCAELVLREFAERQRMGHS